MWGRYNWYPQITDWRKKKGLKRLSDIPEVTLLVSDRAELDILIFQISGQCSFYLLPFGYRQSF